MLYRNAPPLIHRWNGIGGKLEADETPLEGVRREVHEEAGIDLNLATGLRFTGIVTWPQGADPLHPRSGMYAFIADLPSDYPVWEGEQQTPEGLLGWKPLAWVCERSNPAVALNLPYILPDMFSQAEPQEYYCEHKGERFVGVTIHSLPQNIVY